MRIEQITNRKDEITRIAERHGATNIRVFGSVSRGDADNNSVWAVIENDLYTLKSVIASYLNEHPD